MSLTGNVSNHRSLQAKQNWKKKKKMKFKAPRKIELKWRYATKKRESDDSFLNSKVTC